MNQQSKTLAEEGRLIVGGTLMKQKNLFCSSNRFDHVNVNKVHLTTVDSPWILKFSV
jgi:hypothetical protein